MTHPPARARRLVAAALAAGLLVPAAATGAHAATTETQRQIVPAYFYPDDSANLWPAMCSAPSGSIAVANPDSGPGTAYDPAYAEVIAACRAAGQRVIGYVHTSYGERSLEAVKADIDRFYAYYGIQGVFLDEMSNDEADRDYYRRLDDHVKAKGAAQQVVGNPGAAAATNWQLAVTDVVIVFENTAAAYDAWTAPAWTLAAPAAEIGHLVHTAPAAQRDRVAHLSAQRNAGYVFVTDDVMANPWDTLPSYWGTDAAPSSPERDDTAPPASPFTDVATTRQFYREMAWLAETGISTGWTHGDGTRSYRPLEPVTRDAMAAFLYRLAGSPDHTPPPVSPFRDVSTAQPFYKEISWLAETGISTGWTHGDGTRSYRPLDPVTRDAMAAFLYRLAGSPDHTAPAVPPFTDVRAGQQHGKEMSWLAASGISTGWRHDDGTVSYRPLDTVKRDAMAAFLFRLAPLL